MRQTAKGFGLVEKARAKPLGGGRIVGGNVADDFLEILKGQRGKDYLVIHPESRCRASCSDTPGPHSCLLARDSTQWLAANGWLNLKDAAARTY